MASTAAPAIETNALTKRYAGGTLALDGVDLVVPQGSRFGLLGPNGAGKSTLLRILMDLIRPTTGSARIMGHDTQGDPIEARRQVGYLPSDPRFPQKMTSTQLFEYIANVRGLEPRADYMRYVATLVERLEVDRERPFRALSRGNQQKVALTAALMARPPLVILDEPTTGLDPLTQEVVQELVRETAAEGRTVFFSSHILPEVEAACDRVGLVRHGRLAGVYELAEQRLIAPRRVVVDFDVPPPAGAFEGLPGVDVLNVAGTRAEFTLHDGFDALLKRLAAFTVLHLEAREPTLEEFFLSLYGEPESVELER